MDGLKQSLVHYPRNRFFVGLALFALASMVFHAPVQAESKQLRWKLQPGDALQVSFNQDMRMSTGEENGVQTEANMGMSMRWDVKQIDAQGAYNIHQTIDRVTMDMKVPGAHHLRYDSAKPGDPQGLTKALAMSIDPLVGIDFRHTMTNRGEILDVELSERSRKYMGQIPSTTQLQQVFSKDGLRSLLHQAATVLPQNAIEPGATWSGESKTSSPMGSMMMDMTYVYRGTERVEDRPLERIDVDVKVRFVDEKTALGMKVDIHNQENKGTLFFDAKRGRFTNTELRQQMDLVTSIGQRTHHQKLETVLKMDFAPATPRSNVQQASATESIP